MTPSSTSTSRSSAARPTPSGRADLDRGSITNTATRERRRRSAARRPATVDAVRPPTPHASGSAPGSPCERSAWTSACPRVRLLPDERSRGHCQGPARRRLCVRLQSGLLPYARTDLANKRQAGPHRPRRGHPRQQRIPRSRSACARLGATARPSSIPVFVSTMASTVRFLATPMYASSRTSAGPTALAAATRGAADDSAEGADPCWSDGQAQRPDPGHDALDSRATREVASLQGTAQRRTLAGTWQPFPGGADCPVQDQLALTFGRSVPSAGAGIGPDEEHLAWKAAPWFALRTLQGDGADRIARSGSWKAVEGRKLLAGLAWRSSTPRDRLTSRSQGTNAALVASVGPWGGRVRVIVDGVKGPVIDLRSPVVRHRRIVWSSHLSGTSASRISFVVLGRARLRRPRTRPSRSTPCWPSALSVMPGHTGARGPARRSRAKARRDPTSRRGPPHRPRSVRRLRG